MQRSAARKLVTQTATAAVASVLVLLATGSCDTAPTAFLVNGPGQLGNDPPTLQIVEPIENVTRSQGSPLLIRWVDTDSDDNAEISFELVSIANSARVPLVTGLAENDLSGPDSVTVGTTLVPQGSYQLVGTINDGTNDPVQSYATVGGTEVGTRIIVRITGEGEGQQSVPPVLAVTQPAFGQSVTQDDIVRVTVIPSILGEDPNRPFDPDSDILMTLLLDLDQDPNNDDPSNPDPNEIIVLEQRNVSEGSFEAQLFTITVDLDQIPARQGGLPYFVRVTASDLENPRVHRYAVGTINVNQLASGTVDLANIGSITSGARFYGFNPGALTGSSISSVSDFDVDGAADFVMVSQKGNPRNVGPVGEAYLVYGQVGQTNAGDPDPTLPGVRFGGAIPVNSIAQTVSGVIFEAPANRLGDDFHTDGITDVSFIDDIGEDGRPDLLFGLAHVAGAFEGMDFDPGDSDIQAEDTLSIRVEIRERLVEVFEDDESVSQTSYRGVTDTTISALQSGTALGSENTITWQNDPDGDRRWALLKYEDLLSFIPDNIDTIEVGSISAELEVRVLGTEGSDATVHRAITDFNNFTTYNSYAGQDPVEGVDYLEDDFGSVSGGSSEIVSVGVDDYVTQLLDGILAVDDNELRFIFVPPVGDQADDGEGVELGRIRSSEDFPEGERPKLVIEYARENVQGGTGCYPDLFVNNETDQVDGLDDTYIYAGGMTVVVDSTNRDNSPRFSEVPERLDTTSVSLELSGQRIDARNSEALGEVGIDSDILARADDYNSEERIAGARFVAGWYDFVDDNLQNQPPRNGLFGQSVASMLDVNLDGLNEIVVSAPRNELYISELEDAFGANATHRNSTFYEGSIVVFPGTDYNDTDWREFSSDDEGNSVIPVLDQQNNSPFGSCTSTPPVARHVFLPTDDFEIFAEAIDDGLGGARSAGDFNQDGIGDLVCGAPLNDRNAVSDTGAAYILYGRSVLGDYLLSNADDPILRTPMLRIRGVSTRDQVGWRQTSGLDVNGDRIDDVFISTPWADFGGISRNVCADDFNRDGLVNDQDLQLTDFNNCERTVGDAVFSDDRCKVFDYDNDNDIDFDDQCVFCCLSGTCTPDSACVVGTQEPCCDDMVDNGFVGVIFGGVFTDGDRTINQLASTDLSGARFFGAGAQHLAGWDVASAGDFNQDGFGDLLIAAPGEIRVDTAGRKRLGVVYLIFGGTHLANTTSNLSLVGSEDLPGIVFLSPYVAGRPNEAAPVTVAGIGDINNDGFDDIAIGNPKADFIDLSFPQGPEAPGLDAEVGRRRNAGDVYVIYGNNFGSNR